LQSSEWIVYRVSLKNTARRKARGKACSNDTAVAL
jgi:hypothetical protein